MKKEITITISGQANTGKSTMMFQIEKLLKDNGFDVEINFKGHHDHGENTYHFHNLIEPTFDKEISLIKSNVKIILKEMQLAREIKKGKEREFYTNC